MSLNIIRQDIFAIKSDAIVNPSNPKLIGYSGIDYRIHELGGDKLEAECKELVPLAYNEAVLTNAYNLNCKYIIHVAGPYYIDGEHNESEDLHKSYESVLECALSHQIKHLALPLISSGSYGFPKDQCLMIALNAIYEFLNEHEMDIDLVIYDKESYQVSSKFFSDIKEYIFDEEECDFNVLCKQSARICECEDEAFFNDLDLKDFIANKQKSFKDTLFEYIDRSGQSDPEVYKKAYVDRKTFSKIKNQDNYHPSRNTVICFALALHLDLEETNNLLATCGYILSQSSIADRIVMYCIEHKKYNIYDINLTLIEANEQTLYKY